MVKMLRRRRVGVTSFTSHEIFVRKRPFLNRRKWIGNLRSKPRVSNFEHQFVLDEVFEH